MSGSTPPISFQRSDLVLAPFHVHATSEFTDAEKAPAHTQLEETENIVPLRTLDSTSRKPPAAGNRRINPPRSAQHKS
eukprot:3557414-Rhodomonas_salina.2